jgi:hypothetical protein
MAKRTKVQGKDVPLANLVPLCERDVNLKKHRGFARIRASIGAVGLSEPLCVYRENGKYCILDGFLRFKACQELGVREVPCLVFRDKEAYTFNRMVNRLSPIQEMRMLRTAIKTIDESTVAETFGMKSISYRLGEGVVKELHPRVVKAMDDGTVSRRCAREFAYVKPERQLAVLREMQKTGDYSLSFARALVLKTPGGLRNPRKRRKLWVDHDGKRLELVTKLQKVEKDHGDYARLYRRYCTDLLKMCFFVRKLVANEKVRAYLGRKHPEILKRFEGIALDTGEGEAA